MAKKISIITPVYNGEKFIRQTIESILAQAGDFYIDYIVINDGSTDSTEKVIGECEQLWKNGVIPKRCLGDSFRHWSRLNKGQTPTINEGFSAAEGEILAWMNADDYYLPGAFAAVAKTFEENSDIDFVYGDCLKINEGGDKPPTTEPKPRPNETLESLRARGNSFDMNFFTKRIFEKVGPLDESLHYCMDLDFWFRVFAAGKAKYLPYTLAAFRLWPGSKTSTSQNKFAVERKLLAKRYGGNVIPAKKIYRLRGKLLFLNFFQQKTPRFYALSKKIFYRFINLFRYQTKLGD